MTIQELGSLGEVIGAVAVIVTLFYLARQVRDNSAHVRAAAIIEINRLINEGFDPIYGNPDHLDVWFRGLDSRTDLNDFDRNLFDLFMARIMNSYTTVLTQTRKGTMDPEDFVRYLGVYRGIAQSPGGQHWLDDIGSQLIGDDAAKVLEAADPRPLIATR